MVIIKRRAIKLEETTVTRQSIQPKKPTIKRPTNPLQIKGSKTHLTLLKTIPKVNIKRNKTPMLKKLRSLLIKLIMSAAIIAVPPK